MVGGGVYQTSARMIPPPPSAAVFSADGATELWSEQMTVGGKSKLWHRLVARAAHDCVRQRLCKYAVRVCTITALDQALLGTPVGTCGSFAPGSMRG